MINFRSGFGAGKAERARRLRLALAMHDETMEAEIEVRQVFDVSDFPEDVRKAADNPTVRAQVEKRKAS